MTSMRANSIILAAALVALTAPVALPPAAWAADAPDAHPAETFARTMLERMGAVIEGCPQALHDQYPDRIVVCAAYPKSYSYFKLEWETTIAEHDLKRSVVPSTPWVLRGGIYVREYEAGDIPVAVLFNDRTGRMAIAFVPPEPAEEGIPPAKSRVPEGFLDAPRIHVAGFGGVTMPELIEESRVDPVVPNRFSIARMEGSVLLSVVVLADGSVRDVRVLRADPEGWDLGPAAAAAVEQWRYVPATLDGEPVDVQHTVRVRFARPNSP